VKKQSGGWEKKTSESFPPHPYIYTFTPTIYKNFKLYPFGLVISPPQNIFTENKLYIGTVEKKILVVRIVGSTSNISFPN
jgi:hypothetical protein